MESTHHKDRRQRNLLITTLLNFIISTVEIAGGFISGSLALLSDALHNLSDAVAVLIAYIAGNISSKQPDHRMTFGFKRAEILAALINALILIVVTIYLFYAAYQRLREPAPVTGSVMFLTAVIGLLANVVAVFILRRDAGQNMNVRAAYLHLLGDSLSSVAVIAGSILIYFFKLYWIDPVVTMIVGVYILKHAWMILREAVDILMQSGPRNIHLAELCRLLESLPSVNNIHHVHIWNLTDQQIHFEGHVELQENLTVEQTGTIRKQMEQILWEKFRISHLTVQFEYRSCDDKEMIHREERGERRKEKGEIN
ncbi:MAG: cation diffusion facilitator family transporter [Bacteroidales bacterium]|nr:cation transporter [Lentimicrobiaceae bacterium]MDD5694607.1 cation diffusion facilitator family transporter [Bacteroidales bacterium]